MALSTCVEDVSSEYAVSYLESFLPVYQRVNQSAISNVADRYQAIRFAADASLALTASGACWSAALGKTLGDVYLDEATCDDRFSRSFEADIATEAASLAFNSNLPSDGKRRSSFCKAVLSTVVGMNGSSRFKRNGATRGRFQSTSRAGQRRAILKRLSMKTRSRGRLMKASRKPRMTLRKLKSILGSRRTTSCPAQVLGDFVGSARSIENGINALQRLVPGGLNMDEAVLLDEAVDFVMFLKLQVQALQSVAEAVDERFGA